MSGPFQLVGANVTRGDANEVALVTEAEAALAAANAALAAAEAAAASTAADAAATAADAIATAANAAAADADAIAAATSQSAAATSQSAAATSANAAAASAASIAAPVVSANTHQALTSTQQRIARLNVGVELGLDLPANYRTTAGIYALSTQDHGKLHVARNTGTTIFNVAGIAIGKVMWIAADYNVGPVTGTCIVDAGPGYYFRNTTRRDGSLLTGSSAHRRFRLWPGDVAAIWKFTTNEYWIVGGYARPSYVPLGTDGAQGFIARGHDGNYYGKWLRTLVAGDNTLTFSTIYSGAPAFAGAVTKFGGFAIEASTGVASMVTLKSVGAGTMVLNNGDSVSRSGLVEFWNLRI